MVKPKVWLQPLGIVLAIALAIFFLGKLQPILMLIGAFLAYLGNPLVCRLQRWHFPRSLAAISVFVFILLMVVLFFVMLIPLLQTQTQILWEKLPTAINYLQTQLFPWVNAQAAHWNLPTALDENTVGSLFESHWHQGSEFLTQFWQTLSRSSSTLITWVMNLLLIPVVTFYLLRDWPRLLSNLEDLLPRQYAKKTLLVFNECDEVHSAFFRGQLLVMLALGVMYAIGLSWVGLQTSLLIGLIAGVLSIVPYLGFTVGLVLALLAGFVQFHFGMNLVWIVAVFLIGNVIEGMILTPWLVGDKIGLHPVAVIFAILAGGHLFGFIGVLLALPVAAVLMVLLRHLKHSYKASLFYS